MKHLFRFISFTLLLAVVSAAIFPAAAADGALTALFDSYAPAVGTFTLTADSRFYIVSDSTPTGIVRSTVELASSRMAAMELPSAAALCIAYGAAEGARSGDIILLQDATLPEEGYRLDITADSITVRYAAGEAQSYYGGEGSHNGLLYGLQAMMRLFDGSTADCCTVIDAPDTKERTVQLDIGRKYWTMNWIKNFIDEMSWMGYNALDLHLTEDQGCRANIWRDNEGTPVSDCNGNDFGWMIGYHGVSWNQDYHDPNADRFYSRDDLTELVEYAKSRHIEIIPAVDYPTHADCLIAKYQANFVDTGIDFSFRYHDTLYSGHAPLQGGNNATINVADDYARNLTFAVTQAYADFFGSFGCSKFNIGGDEVSGASYRWADSDFNLSNGGSSGNYKDAYVIYMNRLAAVLKAERYGSDLHGYRVRAWNDSLFGTGYYCYLPDGTRPQYTAAATVAVDPDIEVCFWTAVSTHRSPSELAAEGRTVYNCINWYTYYVLRYNSTYGDARDDSCLQWTFNHGCAQRLYAGCGNACAYSCRHTGGWSPADFNGCTDDCFTDQFVTDSALGGGYFLIWGDWAGLDTEESIWTRTDSYGLLDRMWANAAKQWNWDAELSVNYADFASLTARHRTFPGFTSCTSLPKVPSAGELLEESTLEILLKTKVGQTEKLLSVLRAEVSCGEAYRVEIPRLSGYAYSRAEGAELIVAPFGASCGTVCGTAHGGSNVVTLWFDNTPYLAGLEMVLKAPLAGTDNAYANALTAAQKFYGRIWAHPSTTTDQETVDKYLFGILSARNAPTK